MRSSSARSGHRSTFLLLLCVIALGATGCFLQPLPEDRSSDRAAPSVDAPSEPAVEEPIRDMDDEDVVDDSDDGFDDDVPFDEIDEVPIEQFGDLNNDGVIDDEDIAAFRDQFGNFADDELAGAADLDGDGRVTLVDFQMFLSQTIGGGQ